jgi:hypothetical protein
MAVGFRFSKIIIIESLEVNEIRTGEMLSQFIEGEARHNNLNIKVELHKVSHTMAFVKLLEQIKADIISKGEIPLLHIECHGHPEDGLEFENSSLFSWESLSESLSLLNAATKFNLFVILSACFGGHLLKQVSSATESPGGFKSEVQRPGFQ